MKIRLNKEQCGRLVDLGVHSRKWTSFRNEQGFNEAYEYFTLTDLLEILPKGIYEVGFKIFHLTIESVEGQCGEDDILWFVSYSRESQCKKWFANSELIDALYEVACWYYGEYLKSESNGKGTK